MIFPVGHYLGDHLPEDEPVHRQIRVGDETHTLVGDEEFTAWTVAHERPAQPPDSPAAAESLVQRGLLVRVEPHTVDAFADAYRLQPLLNAFGTDDDGRWIIGYGGQPAARLDDQLHDLWWFAGPSASLASLCASRGVPVEVLLERVHGLLGTGCAYFDTVLVHEPD